MATRRTTTTTPDLSSDVTAILLAGWGSSPPLGEPRTRGFGGGFIHLLDVDGIVSLWTSHRAWLIERARVWGWVPTYEIDGSSEKVYYGEYVTRRGREW